jgi:hypothetical protein
VQTGEKIVEMDSLPHPAKMPMAPAMISQEATNNQRKIKITNKPNSKDKTTKVLER